MPKQGHILQGETIESARKITHARFKLETYWRERHFPDAAYSERQHRYLDNPSVKGVWVAIHVSKAEEADYT